MEEFLALAARVAASVRDLRGVLILSRDGLVLGAFPEGDEALIKPAWLRFAGLGEPEKGFVEFADELWAYVRRGPYASFAVSGPGARPGLVMDQLEQMLLAAEEIRGKREIRVPDAAPAPSGKPRTSLHPEAKPPAQPAAAEAAPARPAPPQASPAPSRPGVQVGGAYAAAQPPGPQPPPPRIAQGSPVPRSVPSAPSAPSAPAGPVSAAPPTAPGVPPPRVPPDVSGPSSAPSPAPAPDGGPERPPPERAPAPEPPEGAKEAAPAAAPSPAPAQPSPNVAPESQRSPAEAPEAPPPEQALEVPAAPKAPVASDEEEGEIDAVLLAQEFSRLLQESAEGDET
jgi:hypothetical protein